MENQSSANEEGLSIPDGLFDSTGLVQTGQRLAELLALQHNDTNANPEELIKEVLGLCMNSQEDFEVDQIESVVVNLCLFLAIFILRSESEIVDQFIALILETTSAASQEGLLIPYFKEESDADNDDVEFDYSNLSLPRRISLSMCFDSFTENEAVAVFFHTIANALNPENEDLIAKLEVFEKPLDGPYSEGSVKATEFMDVNGSKDAISKLMELLLKEDKAA